ncbi:hypothetical protein AZKH_1037 [Azoarcus sp. KH32C]|nr:hypothetical protein AZKH_1037 [Azoarcus sp. KH32C]
MRSPRSAMSQEIELKLSLPRRALPALRRHPLFVAAEKQGNAVTLDNTYFDTPDLALKKRKIAVRTRRQGRVQLQTIKCETSSAGGLTQRPEWEQPYGDSFDFSAVDVPKVRKVLQRHAAALAPVFSTRFRRETRLHAPADGVRILMMLDTGDIIAGERSEALCELELELVEGRPQDLLVLARQLAAGLPLLPDDSSKAARGFRLHLDQPVRPQRAEASGISSDQDPVEAFRTLAFACLRHWQGNVAGAAAGTDPEYTHQLRVALRRLRSLIRLFTPALPPTFVEDWSARLADNAAAFGAARDLDVLCDELLLPILDAGSRYTPVEAVAIAELAERAHAARKAAYDATRVNIDRAAQGRQLLDLTAALLDLPRNPLIDAADLGTFARIQLDALRKKARRRHAAIAEGVPQTLHALRIAAKRLRYAIEFFSPLLPAKQTESFLRSLLHAQADLGFVNDVDIARARLAAWAAESAELRAAAAYVCGWHGPRYLRWSRRAVRALDRLLDGRPPWAD